MLRLINDVLLAPENTPAAGASPTGPLTHSAMEKLLTVDDEETPEEVEVIELDEKPKKPSTTEVEVDEDDTEVETEKEDEEDEEEKEKTLEDELEEDLKEPGEEDLEVVTPVRRKEILAKYPQLFKDFPYLEKAYYREQKYTELLPTIQDAEEAVNKAQTWDKFEQDLTDGDLKGILTVLNQHDKNTFNKIADTILDTIQEIDAPAAQHIYSGVAKQIITLMVNAGQQQGNEGLKTAAALVHQFLFGAREWEDHKPLYKAQPKDPRADEVAQKERQLLQRQFVSARDEIGSKINNTIKATIERNIDPKESMTTYVKGKAIEDILSDVQSQMKADKRFQAVMTKLWENAARNDFNDQSKQAIRSAVMSKAKQLLPSAIQKGRKTALGATPRKTTEREVTRPVKSGPDKTGKTTSPMNRGNDRGTHKGIPVGMSVKDFLLKD